MAGQFMSLSSVAERLAISPSQAYAMVRSGALPAIKVGGRGQWRVDETVLDDYITRMYAETRDRIAQQSDRPPGSAGGSPPR